jgi:Ras-related protein Rab-22
MYYRGAGAAILVYDITRQDSFEALKDWVQELKLNGSRETVIFIVGNKLDLEAERVSFNKFQFFHNQNLSQIL